MRTSFTAEEKDVHRLLLRTGANDPSHISRVLGVLYLAGGLLVLLSLQLSHPDAAIRPGLWGIAVVGFVFGSASIIWAKHARLWTVHTVLAFGTACVSLCVYFAGVASGVYSAMYVWVVLVAASFFVGRAIAAHVAWILLSWGLALTQVTDVSGFSPITRWALGSFVLVVTATVMSEIVAGRRAAERKSDQLQRELEQLAHHDPLTGLANRRLFEQELKRELARAKRQGSPLCLVVVDLDKFKEYNDANGHVAGDQLLKSTAAAWASALRAEDLIARLGGDEFIVLLPDCPLDEGVRVAQRLCRGVPLEQTCSTGITSWDGQETGEELIARADGAMYESKDRRTARSVVRAVRSVHEGPKARSLPEQ